MFEVQVVAREAVKSVKPILDAVKDGEVKDQLKRASLSVVLNIAGSDAEGTITIGETVTISHTEEHPSRLVLPVVGGVAVPPTLPACTSLRGQPCRQYAPAGTGG